MFQVFDNNTPAEIKDSKVGWNKSTFDTFEEAEKYAQNWLGQYAGMVLELNKPVDYSGYGDSIEIRKLP